MNVNHRMTFRNHLIKMERIDENKMCVAFDRNDDIWVIYGVCHVNADFMYV